MSAKVIKIFKGPGFFENPKDVVVGDEEAPAYIIEAHQPNYKYFAVLKKITGSIDAADFLKYGRRLATLSYQVYRRAMWELRVDAEIGISFYVSSTGEQVGVSNTVSPIDVSQMNERVFWSLFAWAYRMELCIHQVSMYGIEPDSFTSIEWWRCKPDTLLICADRDSDYEHRARQLEDLLFRKMFYVSGTAPDRNFFVELGFASYNEEAMGMYWPKSARS